LKVLNFFLLLTFISPGLSLRTKPEERIKEIKRALMSEHIAAWGDLASPEEVIVHTSNTTASGYPPFNRTAIEESDEIAWQWGFWPFTKIDMKA
jgi:hypothetical protein